MVALHEKVQVGNDQEIANRKKSPLHKPRGGKNKMTLSYFAKKTHSKPSE